MDLIPGIGATASALNAQRTRLDIIAQNIANAHTTHGPDGQAYQRQVVSFESELLQQTGAATPLRAVRVRTVASDKSPGERIYDPQHPDADADGMVRMPNVNLAYEMVDLITASRVYEANLSVAKTARQMALKALEIGR